jgi:hypothetical protein
MKCPLLQVDNRQLKSCTCCCWCSQAGLLPGLADLAARNAAMLRDAVGCACSLLQLLTPILALKHNMQP